MHDQSPFRCFHPAGAASDSEEQLQLQDDERQESGVVGGEDGDDGMSSEADEVSPWHIVAVATC